MSRTTSADALCLYCFAHLILLFLGGCHFALLADSTELRRQHLAWLASPDFARVL